MKPWFFLAFDIIISHICAENFIEIPQVVKKIWRISLLILAIFINFNQIFCLKYEAGEGGNIQLPSKISVLLGLKLEKTPAGIKLI